MAPKGTDLFLQVLNERLGLIPPKGAQPGRPRKRNSRAVVIAGALAGGILLASLCSGQTMPGPEGAAPETPAAPAPAASAPAPPAESASAPRPAAPRVAAARSRTSAPAARRSPERSRRGAGLAPAPRAARRPVAATAPAVTYAGPAFEQAAWASKGGAVEPAGRPETTDPEAQPIESYRLTAKEAGRGGNLFADVFGKLVFVLALMLGCAAGWKKLRGVPALRAVTGGPAESMEVVESFNLAPQRQLHLVRVSGQRLLIASTPQSVSLIVELDRPAAPSSPAAAPAGALESGEPEKAEQVVEAEPSRYEQIMNRLRETLVPDAEPAVEAPVRETGPSGLFSGPAVEAEPVAAGSLSGLFRQPVEVRPTAAATSITTSFFSTAATPALGGQDA